MWLSIGYCFRIVSDCFISIKLCVSYKRNVEVED